jgi:hypothetical protein
MSESLQARVDAIKQITELHNFERYTYAGLLALCVLLFLVCIGVDLIHGKLSGVGAAGMLFSSGGAGTSLSRLLHMWNRSMVMLDGYHGKV